MKDVNGKEMGCYFCKKETDDDHFCYGCREYVCESCDTNEGNIGFGKHEVEEHKVNQPNDF